MTTVTTPHVLVLGAGIIGTTSAWYLARAGCRVTLVERRPGVGLETSFANGSLITPSMSDPWAAPGLPWQLLKWLGREDAPFLLRLGALPGLTSFGPAFLRNCTAARWRRNTEIILRLTRYSQALLNELVALTGIAYDGAALGILRLCRDPAALEHAEKVAAAVGVAYRPLDAAGCARLEPAIASAADRIVGGIHFPDDQSGDAYKFTAALAERARDAGVECRFGVAVRALEIAGDRVTGVITDQGRLEADRYLVALGCGGARLLRPLGIALPVYPVKGYSVTLEIDGWNGAPRLPLVDSGRKLAIVRLGDRLRLAGTAELAGYDTTLNPARGANLLESLHTLLPDAPNLGTARHWTGLRPMTPDGIPLLGPTSYQNLFLNLGHGHLGWTMACGSAKLLADLLTGRPPEIDLTGMTLTRLGAQGTLGRS
jgi:D-amino-acid dehydrogenase